ncbi:MAG: heme o synthase [Acidiferrobacterales bacterium]
MKTQEELLKAIEPGRSFSAVAREYYELTKPKVVMLIVFTAVVGMFMATPGFVPLSALIFGTLGIGLAAASAASFNQILDRRADAKMARTRARPLPAGQLTTRQAVVFSIAIGLIAMAVLVIGVNVLTAVLTLGSLIGYSVIYTLYLKRATPQNIVIGGAAGAAPPVLGWVAVTGTIDPHALLLFLIVFVWTPPHFWALALYREEEYAKAGLPMLPVTHGNQFTRLHILLYTIILVSVTLLPYTTHMSGLIYLVGAVVLNSGFLYYAVKLYRNYSDALARKTFIYSVQYLSALFALLLIDHYRVTIIEALQSALI